MARSRRLLEKHKGHLIPEKLMTDALQLCLAVASQLAHGSVSSGVNGPTVCLNRDLGSQGESPQATWPRLTGFGSLVCEWT